MDTSMNARHLLRRLAVALLGALVALPLTAVSAGAVHSPGANPYDAEADEEDGELVFSIRLE